MPRCRRGIIKSYSDKIRGLLIAAFADEDVEIAASLPSSASAPGVAAAVVAHYGPSKDVGISYSDNIGRPNWPGALKQAINGLESIEDTEFKIDNSVVRAFSLPELQMRRSDEGVSISGQVQTDVEARPD